MAFPEPVISVAIEPKTKADQEKLGVALHKLAQEDPTFKIAIDRETGQTLIAGMGELHLEILVDRLFREFSIGANVSKPQVAYKETIKRGVRAEGKFVRQSGGRGQYGHVWLEIEPLERGAGFEFVDAVVGGRSRASIFQPSGKACRRQWRPGYSPGYPVIDLRVRVCDGSYHDVDSSELAFKIAGSMALERRSQEGGRSVARADHGCGSSDPRRIHGRCHREPEFPSWQHQSGNDSCRSSGDLGPRASLRDVRICDRSAFLIAGTCDVYHAFQFVP